MGLPNKYQRNKNLCLTPVYVPAEDYSFYINGDSPLSDPDFLNFELRLYAGDIYITNSFAPLAQDVIYAGLTATLYNIYCEFTFPIVSNGQYQFVVYDKVKGVEKCRSNVIQVEDQEYIDTTSVVYFRNDENAYNYYYENVPDFVNKFRLPIGEIDYQFPVERTTYRNSTNGRFRNIKSELSKVKTIETYNFDEPGHEAAAVMFECKFIFINNVRYIPKDTYNVQTNNLSTMTKGSIECYEYAQETYDPFLLKFGFDTIIFTGDAVYNPDTIIDGN